MAKIRHFFPGGNTCYGFYSFYDYLASPFVSRKIILKGGPGVGKSTLMRQIGEYFSGKGYDIEYHWCSSDNNSIDGVVIGNHKIALLDGTAPHIVEPRYPGAVDEIINLGQFWDRGQIISHRDSIVKLTSLVSLNFTRAYRRLREAKLAYEEWASYYEEAQDMIAVNRNILALSDDFIDQCSPTGIQRHLFFGAITPQGVVTTVDSLIGHNYSLFAVTGSPGSGIQQLFKHATNMLTLNNLECEILHNPFNPDEINLIILPSIQRALINVSEHIIPVRDSLSGGKYRRQLDFDRFLCTDTINSCMNLIENARERTRAGIKDAVSFINWAKRYHDELEGCYVPAMDVEQLSKLRDTLIEEIEQQLTSSSEG
ncbi:MAG: PRK06851 family protein [Syntrophomonadaceae bacterium]|nr:PRK06851 family protein [Syntrophomonadaceae bacterium]